MGFDVFISHSSKDKAIADAVCNMLENNGYRCWIAPRNVSPGYSYANEIMNGIENSKMMVLVYTSNSNVSEPVASEIEAAFNKKKPMIVFAVENEPMVPELDFFLKRKHWLVAYPDYKVKLGELKNAVETVVGPVRTVAEQNLVILKIVPSADCRVLVDFEQVGTACAGKMFKHNLKQGGYNVQCERLDGKGEVFSRDIDIEKDYLLRVDFSYKNESVGKTTDVPTKQIVKKDNTSIEQRFKKNDTGRWIVYILIGFILCVAAGILGGSYFTKEYFVEDYDYKDSLKDKVPRKIEIVPENDYYYYDSLPMCSLKNSK